MSLLMLDLDHFKQVMTAMATRGDHVLREVAEAVRRCLRASDVFGRLGGEEFAVILPTGDDAGTPRWPSASAPPSSAPTCAATPARFSTSPSASAWP